MDEGVFQALTEYINPLIDELNYFYEDYKALEEDYKIKKTAIGIRQ